MLSLLTVLLVEPDPFPATAAAAAAAAASPSAPCGPTPKSPPTGPRLPWCPAFLGDWRNGLKTLSITFFSFGTFFWLSRNSSSLSLLACGKGCLDATPGLAIQGCRRQSEADALSLGSVFSMLFTKSLAASETWAQSSEGMSKLPFRI